MTSTNKQTSGGQEDIPWVAKYRPRNVDDISHQETVKRMLRNVIKTGNMPHCLFYGPPGTGKTSSVLALAAELFGEDASRRVLELNASDDRGIAVVREKIKNWSRTLVGSTLTSDKGGSRVVPNWKIVILDEADMMTGDAQSALRRIIEDNSKTTRFVIICNYLTRIIDPIASRCAKHRFERVSKESQLLRLAHIASSEDLKVEDSALTRLLEISNGDLRVAITLLQTASRLGAAPITSGEIEDVAGCPPVAIAEGLFRSCLTASPKEVEALASETIADGWDVNQLLKQINHLVMFSKELGDTSKARMAHILAASQYRLCEGADEYLQLLQTLTELNFEVRHSRRA